MHFRFPSVNFVKNAHFPELKFLKMSRELLSTFWKGTQPNSEWILIDFMELGLCHVIWIRWWITWVAGSADAVRRDADVFKFVSFTDNFCNKIFAISKLWNKILNFAWFNGDYHTNIASNSWWLETLRHWRSRYANTLFHALATGMHSVRHDAEDAGRGRRCARIVITRVLLKQTWNQHGLPLLPWA
jgi:hypothetical protein